MAGGIRILLPTRITRTPCTRFACTRFVPRVGRPGLLIGDAVRRSNSWASWDANPVMQTGSNSQRRSFWAAPPLLFRDVAFQDVGFQQTFVTPLTPIRFRCEVPTPSVVEGQQTIIFKPHILKHHIPELPTNEAHVCTAEL